MNLIQSDAGLIYSLTSFYVSLILFHLTTLCFSHTRLLQSSLLYTKNNGEPHPSSACLSPIIKQHERYLSFNVHNMFCFFKSQFNEFYVCCTFKFCLCSQTNGTKQQTFLPNSQLERGAASFSFQKTLGEHEADNQKLS